MGWQRHKKGVSLLVNDTLTTAPLNVIAEVAWCRRAADQESVEIGAKFLNIAEDDRLALRTYLGKLRQAAKGDSFDD
jgi:hypothetical protein